MLAPFFLEVLGQRGDVVGVARRQGQGAIRPCDLRDADAVSALIEGIRPDLVVHLAALTDVDACERSPVEAFESNVRATENLVNEASRQNSNVRFIYFSTDQVYDAPGPSTEACVRPGNVYALTKLWGEDHARRLKNALVLRVNFFAGPDAGLISWLVGKCAAGEPVQLFTDVLFNPLHTCQLAESLGELIDCHVTGTLNLGASGAAMSKAQFLRAAAVVLGLDQSGLQDGSVANLDLDAYRPRDMRMNVGQVEEALGHALPSIEDGLALLSPENADTD